MGEHHLPVRVADAVDVRDDCVVLAHLAAEGDQVPVGAPLAVVGEEGEDPSALIEEGKALLEAAMAGPSEPEPPAPAAEPAPQPAAAPAPAEPTAEAETTAASAPPAPVRAQSAPAAATSATGHRVLASPLARSIASQLGVDIGRVSGSGPGGRVLQADVVAAARGGASAGPGAGRSGAASADSSLSFPADGSALVVPNTPMRSTIARRLTEAKSSIPHFYLQVELDVDAMLRLRRELKSLGQRVSLNDMVLRACALALARVPEVNSSWGSDAITYHQNIDVGFAVALPDGLITPVIRGTNNKSLTEISAEARSLAGKARDKRLQPAEYQGATFTISNLGMMGIERFTAIINPPGTAILAVGAAVEKPVVRDGEIVVGRTMIATLSCDHRVVDGATGARFLGALRELIEQPLALWA